MRPTFCNHVPVIRMSSGETHIGANISWSCPTGYELRGSSYLICRDDGRSSNTDSDVGLDADMAEGAHAVHRWQLLHMKDDGRSANTDSL